MKTKIAIVGGGISGLATAHAIESKAAADGLEVELTLLESDHRLGGKIVSERVSGYLLEWGPFGFLDNKPETPKLVLDTGIEGDLLRSNDASRKRFIFTGGSLRKLPENPPAFLKSKILTFNGKIGMLKDLRAKPVPENKDETIAEFAERHLGKEAVDKLIDPMATGIFAGSADSLSLKSCFPVMAELEREGGGSLFRAMLRRRKKKKAAEKTGGVRGEKKERGSTEMGGGVLTTFKDGMDTLVRGVGDNLRAGIISEARVEKIEKDNGGWKIILADNKGTLVSDIVVLAIPAYAAAAVLEELDGAVSQLMRQIPYVPVNVINLGYKKEGLGHDLDGFGFLIPGMEKRRILGAIWVSSVFNGFSPKEKVSLRVMVGGSKNPDVTKLDDTATLNVVQQELKDTMGISADPDFINIIRHQKAIPQYIVGHGERLDQIEGRIGKHPGLFITGNAYRGIGVNDCTRNAQLVAYRIIESIKV